MIVAVGERTDGTSGLIIGFTRADVEQLMEKGNLFIDPEHALLPQIVLVFGRTSDDVQKAMEAIAPVSQVNTDAGHTD